MCSVCFARVSAPTGVKANPSSRLLFQVSQLRFTKYLRTAKLPSLCRITVLTLLAVVPQGSFSRPHDIMHSHSRFS